MRREDRDKALRPAREDWREKKPADEDAPSTSTTAVPDSAPEGEGTPSAPAARTKEQSPDG